jgi:hypothetical protein
MIDSILFLKNFLTSKAFLYIILGSLVFGSYYYAYNKGYENNELKHKNSQVSAIKEALRIADVFKSEEIRKALIRSESKIKIEKQAAETIFKTETIIKEKVIESCKDLPFELTEEINKNIESVNKK